MSNQKGRFGIHGGQYIPETLMNAVIELEEAYEHYKNDPEFNRELQELFNEYAGRPSRLYFAEKMTRDMGGAKIYLKREDLNHTGAHKINNVLGQALLAKKMGKTRLIGCEAAGRGIHTAETAATIATGKLGIFHGMKSYFCQDEYGQIAPVYSISAGLDYPGIGPEHAHLYDIGRAEYVAITDEEAVCAFEYLAKTEGIIPAIESAHAVAYAMKLAPTMRPDQTIVITISGRGDKDCAAIARYRGEDLHE